MCWMYVWLACSFSSVCPLPYHLHQSKPPDLEWFPRLRCMSLHSSDDTEPEQNEMKDLYEQLAETTSLVKTLSQQLGDLRDKVVPCWCQCGCYSDSIWLPQFSLNCPHCWTQLSPTAHFRFRTDWELDLTFQNISYFANGVVQSCGKGWEMEVTKMG